MTDKYTLFDFGLLHIEWTNLLFVLVIFFICAFSMNKLLFQPIIRTLENRKKIQNSGSQKIEQLEKGITNAQEKISSMRKEFQLKLVKYREKQIKEVKIITDKIIADTRNKLEIEKQNFRQDLIKEVEKLEGNLNMSSNNIAEQIKQKIL